MRSIVIYSETTHQLVTNTGSHEVPPEVTGADKYNITMERFMVRQWALKNGLIDRDTEIGIFE